MLRDPTHSCPATELKFIYEFQKKTFDLSICVPPKKAYMNMIVWYHPMHNFFFGEFSISVRLRDAKSVMIRLKV